MLGYEAMAIAAKDPDVEVTWGGRMHWYTYKAMLGLDEFTAPVGGYVDNDFATRKTTPNPKLPEKLSTLNGLGLSYAAATGLQSLKDNQDAIIDYLKAKEEE